MQDFARIFDAVKDPTTSNATRRDLHEMLMISLLCVICGGRTCADMELFGRSQEEFLRRFMKLEHGIPSRGAFSALFRILDPDCLGSARLRLAVDWAGQLGPDVTAVEGKTLRRCTWSTPSPPPRGWRSAKSGSTANPTLLELLVI